MHKQLLHELDKSKIKFYVGKSRLALLHYTINVSLEIIRSWYLWFIKKVTFYKKYVGNGHSDTSSNPGRDWLHFT